MNRLQSILHLEHVLYFDDATLEDRGPHRWDLDGTAMPGLPASGSYNVTTQGGYHRALLFNCAASDEGLRLRDVGSGHDRSRGRIVELRKNRYHLACDRGKVYVGNWRNAQSTHRNRLWFEASDSYQVCNPCGRFSLLPTPVRSCGTMLGPFCPLFQPVAPVKDKSQ